MRRQLAVLLVVALSVICGAAACSKDAGPKPALDAFLRLWSEGKTDGVVLQDADGGPLAGVDVLAELKKLAGDLKPGQAKLTAGEQITDNAASKATVAVDWTVANGVVWSYQTTVKLAKSGDDWRVIWSPQTVHPQLLAGSSFVTSAVPAPRGRILDGAGGDIVADRPVVDVGVVPNAITNQAALIAALDAAFKSIGLAIDLSDLPARIASASPTDFVEVVTLRREAYNLIRNRIHDLDGTAFHEGVRPLAPTRSFARALLGTVGDVTREQLDTNPGRYIAGDLVGQSGLQQVYDLSLRGADGVRVVITRHKNSTDDNKPDEMVFNSDPKAGAALKTTLDQKIQTAADNALAGQPLRSAIVAVRISDGAIVAAANGPDGGEVNLAFTASVPPGSTFKMITALGLLDKGGVTADTVVNCPKTFTVQGRTFTNAGGYELGAVPFRTDFAKSCNTAFASLAPQLQPDLLAKAGASVGVGTSWNLGVAANTGSVPANVSDVEAAAAAFGQGQTLVSPLVLAGATAAVARGSWVQPTLFGQLPPGAPKATSGTAQPANGAKLNPNSVAALRSMMREVVTQGTATALLGLPGGDVFAKTGTAEYDNNPANTHAWTIGWRGDIAFAVFVEKGGSSSATAVPITAAFLKGF